MPKEKQIDIDLVTDFGQDTSFVIGTLGQGGSGKSRLPVTGPDLTAIIPIDRKTRRTVEKVMQELDPPKKFGRNILMPREDLVTSAVNPVKLARMGDDEIKELYRKRADRVKEITWAFHENDDVRLIAIDSFGQLCRDIEYAHYGRVGHKARRIDQKMFQDRTQSNQEIIDFINSISSKFLILTHKGKPEYKKNKATGRLTWDGFRFLPNHCEVIIEQEVNLQWNPNAEEDDRDYDDVNWQFGVTFQNCQGDPELQGPAGRLALTDEGVTFENLAMLAFPDLDADTYS